MSEHLSREEIKNYIARRPAPAEILRIDDHLAACAECMKMIERAPDIKAMLNTLESIETEQHLSFETMSQFVDGTLDEAGHEIADVHISECTGCGDAVRELRNMRSVLTAGTTGEVEKKNKSSANSQNSISWWKFLVPAAAAIFIGIFVWVILMPGLPQQDLSNIPNTNVNNGMIAEAPETEANSNIGASNVNNDPRTIVAGINDAGGRIEIDSEGRISGISADHFEQKLRAAISNQAISVSPDARQLRTSAGTLMGPSAPGVPFRLIGPVGRVVEMQRPPFRWRPMPRAESYKVGVYNEGFGLVAESPALKAANWTPGKDLPRGRVYQWQVTAFVDGKEVVSPTRPAGEARFKIVDAADAAEIQRARRIAGNSHLLMGIVYSNAGMLTEAEREFQALLQKNPKSEMARKLLAKIRNAK